MLFSTPMKLRVLTALGLAALLSSCASNKPSANSEKVCREKFASAKDQFERKRDVDAQEKLKDLTISCYGYDFQEEAQYMLATSYFRTEQWPEAETEYRLLREQFERSRHAEEALYKIARCGIEQTGTWDRDPSSILDAQHKITEYLTDFPEGKWSAEMRKQYTELDSRLANHDFQTARLYLRLGEPLSATIYFNKLLKEHPGWDKNDEARIQLALAYAKIDQFDQARATLTLLHSAEDSTHLQPKIKSAEKDIASLEKAFQKRRAREAEGYKTGFF